MLRPIIFRAYALTRWELEQIKADDIRRFAANVFSMMMIVLFLAIMGLAATGISDDSEPTIHERQEVQTKW